MDRRCARDGDDTVPDLRRVQSAAGSAPSPAGRHGHRHPGPTPGGPGGARRTRLPSASGSARGSGAHTTAASCRHQTRTGCNPSRATATRGRTHGTTGATRAGRPKPAVGSPSWASTSSATATASAAATTPTISISTNAAACRGRRHAFTSDLPAPALEHAPADDGPAADECQHRVRGPQAAGRIARR